MAFYMDAESKFYQDMSGYLKKDLGVKVPITGTADHSHTSSPYTMLASLSKLDILDGHVYWQHPGSPPPVNTPMVNDPLHSTVVQLSRTAFAGKPYTVSETNHPFPNDWASEGIPILAAYGSFQDWDAIIMYTFEPKRDAELEALCGRSVRYLARPGAHDRNGRRRADVPARRRAGRARNRVAHVLQGAGAGEPPAAAHRSSLTSRQDFRSHCRWSTPCASSRWMARRRRSSPRRSRTHCLGHQGTVLVYRRPEKTGLVTVETDRTQALIGFVKANAKL